MNSQKTLNKLQPANAELCTRCSDMLLRSDQAAVISNQEVLGRQTGSDVAESVASGCGLCKIVGEALKVNGVEVLHAKLIITARLEVSEVVGYYDRPLRGFSRQQPQYCTLTYSVMGAGPDFRETNAVQDIQILLVPAG